MSTDNKKKKKIAIVHNLSEGGSLRYLGEVNKELRNEYELLVFKPRPLSNTSRGLLKIISYLNYCYLYLPSYYFNLAKELNNSDIYGVIVHHDFCLKTPNIFNGLKKRNIYIFHEPPREFYEPIQLHSPKLIDKIFNFFRIPIYFIDKYSVKKARMIVANSDFSKRRIKTLYDTNSRVVYPGISNHFRKPILLKRKNQCISVGSMLPYKGHSLVIEALGLIERDRPNLVIVGLGRSDEIKEIDRLATEKKVNLRIVEHPKDNILKKIYNGSSIYVNAAFQEPFGLSSLEALSMGCKLVTVSKCGTEELKKYCKDGVYICDRNPTALKNSILKAKKSTKFKCQLPNVFTWKYAANQLIKLLMNET